jgi:hypothetical protein
METKNVAFESIYTIPNVKSKKNTMETKNVAFGGNCTIPNVKSKKNTMETKLKLNGKKIKPEVLKWIKENKEIILRYRKLKNEWYNNIN